MQRECEQCKEMFRVGYHKSQRFCKMDCWSVFKRKRKTFVCQWCGKSFLGRIGKPNKFCSHPCANIGKTLPRDEFWRRWKLRVKEYRRKNPEKTATWKNNRRSREMGAEGNFTAMEWTELKNKHLNKCARCGISAKLTVDHIKPLSRGGSNYIENIQPLCMPCNSRKSVKT